MKEYIQKLRALADRLDELEPEKSKLEPNNISHAFWKKEDLVEAIRNIGGKWTKRLIGREDAEYCMIQFASDRYPLHFTIMRDKVCTKKVTFECEPIFAPGEAESLVLETAEAK
jgi:hypothetical protein